MDFVIKCGKDDMAQQGKMIKVLMMQGVRSSSSIKKLAKVDMPTTFSKLAMVRTVEKFLLEMDNHYDVQRYDEDDKVSIVMTILNDHAFQW